jgi:chromosome segregation and condensation protein ScpB
MAADYKTSGPVTLTEEQILELHQKLRDMRHDVNGRLANIVAAAELIRLRPDQAVAERLKLLLEQPHKASEIIGEFSRAFEGTLGLKRG